MRTPLPLFARGWRGWCLGLAAIGLGGLLWWWYAGEDRPRPILSPEMRRQEALVFLRLAAKEDVLGDPDNSLRDIAETQAVAGDVPSAIETVKTIKDPCYRGRIWVAIAMAQLRAGDRPGSRQSLASALEEPNDPANPCRDIVFGEVAAAQADDGLIEEAGRTAQAITAPHDRVTAWNAIAMAQAKGGDPAGCRRSIAMAVETARGIVSNPAHEGDDTIVRAWCAVAATQAKTGDTAGRDESFAQAVAAALAMQEHGEHVVGGLDGRINGLLEIAEEQLQTGDPAGRDRIFALAQETAHRLPEKWQERARGIFEVALHQAWSGDVAGTMAAMQEIAEDDSRDAILAALAEFQAKGDGLREALATVRAIRASGVRTLTLLKVASVRDDAGDTAGRRETLALALQAARDTPDTDRQSEMLGRVASAQAEAGDSAAAVRTLDNRWKEEYLDAWSEIAIARARAGDIAGARRIAPRLQPRPAPWWNRCWDRFLAAVGHPRSAPVRYSGGDDPTPYNWTMAVCSIAAAQARTGDRRAAIATVQALPKDRGGNSYYRRVGRDLLRYPTKLAEF